MQLSAPPAPPPVPEAASSSPTASSLALKAVITAGKICAPLAAYLLVGTVVYGFLEPDWSVQLRVYFLIVTLSTVGYGDVSPTNGTSRLFTLIMIFLGIASTSTAIAQGTHLLTSPLTARGRALLEHAFPQNRIDVDNDGAADFVYPRHWAIYYAKNLVPSILLNVVMTCTFAAGFVWLEGWRYGDAVYHCLVTGTTVGYGDMSIVTDDGRLLAMVHILLSVAMIAEVVSTIGELAAARASAFERLSILQHELDAAFIDSMLARAGRLRAGSNHVADDDEADGLTELEFVLTALLELGVIEEWSVRPFVKRFRALDADGSGRLGRADLVAKAKQDLRREVLRMGGSTAGRSTRVMPHGVPR